MTTVDTRGTIDVPRAGRIGQATAVEQSRAIAEVHAAIVVAQQVPRDIPRAVADMQRSCAQKSLAERAFFRYSRGGSQISGPSVQLARELARSWGNCQYGVTELRRDDVYKQSEMQAWAWDVQTNARSSTTFIVPHRRDTKNGAVDLVDMRDIYEQNANNGARRLREMIFAILPGWYTEDAVQACYETLAAGDDGTPAELAAKIAGLFAPLNVPAVQLEQKIGAPRARWSPQDRATLHVIYRSLMRGETTAEAEFDMPAKAVGAADITKPPSAGPQTADPAAAATEPAPPGAPKFRRLTKTTLGKLKGALFSVPLGNSQETHEAVSALAGRKVQSVEDLSEDEARNVLGEIDRALEAAGADRDAAGAALREVVAGVLAAQRQDDDAEQVPDDGA